MWVPVTVKDDDSVGSLQVEAEAASSGTEQEDEVLRSFLIKLLQQRRSILRLGGSWNTKRDQYEISVKITLTKSAWTSSFQKCFFLVVENTNYVNK